MDNILLKYMQDRFKDADQKDRTPIPERPVLTIARDFGCPSKEIAQMLFESIRQGAMSEEQPWRMISKEILQHSAKELNLHPSKLDYVYRAQDKTMMDEILEALGEKYHKSDKAIRKTISNVVIDMSARGNLIIVGMGASSILMNQPNTFHIKLAGPLKWRIQNVQRWQGISHLTASKLVREIDEQRRKLIHSFLPATVKEPSYDLVFNCMNIADDEIVEIVHDLIVRRSINGEKP